VNVVIIVLGFSGLFLFLIWPQIMSAKSLRKNRGKAVESLEDVVGVEVAAQSHLVLYFFGPGCGKCRAMTPRIDALIKEHSNLCKINSEEHRDWAIQLGVVGLPSIAVLRDGKLQDLSLGTVSTRKIKTMLVG